MHPFRLIHHEHSSRRPCVSPARVEAMLPDGEGFGDWHLRSFRNGSVHVFGWYTPANRSDYYQGSVPFTVKLRRSPAGLALDVRAASHVEDFLFGLFLSSFAPILRQPEGDGFTLDSNAWPR